MRRAALAAFIAALLVFGLRLGLPVQAIDGARHLMLQRQAVPAVQPRALVRTALPAHHDLPAADNHVRSVGKVKTATSIPGRGAQPPGRAAGASRVREVGPRVPGTTIVIPRLGIDAPVREAGVKDGRPDITPDYGAVMHFLYSTGLGERGNYVVYGHDDIDGNVFEYLGNLRPGDRVYLRRGGREYTYTVTGSRIVAPTEVSVLNPTPDATLTLITCTPMYVDSQRIVVRARLRSPQGS